MRIGWLLVIAACHGSSSSSSFHDSVQALCDLPDHVPPKDKPYPDRLAEVAKWADAHVTDPEARALGSIDKDINKDKLADAAKRAGIAHCKLLDNDMALQSFADAMADVCAAPVSERDKLPEYMKSHLLNPEVIRLVSSLGNLNPPDQKQRLHDAAARAGITSCPVIP